MDTLLQDLRYAFRQLRRRPGFTAVAVLTLALGIGANAAIFTLLDRALLRPLPVEAPERLVVVSTLREGDRRNMNFSYPAYRDYRELSDAFAGLVALSPRSFTLTHDGSAQRVDGAMVSADYFDVLGVQAALGRRFAAGEERAQVAVLSHDFWRRRFGAEAAVIGRTISLDGQPFTIVGVAPEGFHGLWRGASPDLWVPFEAGAVAAGRQALLTTRNASWLYILGRLAPGLARGQAQASVSAIFRRLEAENPTVNRAIVLDPGARGFTSLLEEYADPLPLLMGAVALVLLIACANVANLLLARANARRREIAVRLALGAGRARLVRQMLTESVLLALLGAAAGLLLAVWMADLLLGFRPVLGEALTFDIAPDARVIGFTLAVSFVAVFLCGLVPALRSSRTEVVPALKEDSTTSGATSRRGVGLRGALVATQVALSLVLLVGAGLLVRSLGNLYSADLGFRARDLLLASFDLGSDYEDEEVTAFQAELMRRVNALPGVRSASLATTITPSPAGSNYSGLVLEAYAPAPDEDVALDVNFVGPDYFATIGMPILRGRGLREGDRRGSPLVAVISETIARRYWPDGGALGKTISLGTDPADPRFTIVGIAGAGRYRGVRERNGLMLYLPILQTSEESRATLLVRTVGDPMAVTGAVRREVRALDPTLPLYDIRTVEDHLRRLLSRERLVATLAALFGALALALAAVGTYGVMAFFAAQRKREIGIRVALGAARRDVLRLILERSATLVALGLVVGIAGALVLTRLLTSLLYEVSPTHAITFAGAVAVLAGTAFLATYLPARRAARADPMIALRNE